LLLLLRLRKLETVRRVAVADFRWWWCWWLWLLWRLGGDSVVGDSVGVVETGVGTRWKVWRVWRVGGCGGGGGCCCCCCCLLVLLLERPKERNQLVVGALSAMVFFGGVGLMGSVEGEWESAV
jgi:hypothetical protein